MRWVSLTEARDQLHKTSKIVRALAALGYIETRQVPFVRARGEGHWDQFALEPLDTRESLLERFYRERAPCVEKEAFAEVKKVIQILRGSPAIQPPRGFLDDALSFLRLKGMERNLPNLRALTGVTEKIGRRHLLDWLEANGEPAIETRQHFASEPGKHEARFIARLPIHLRSAPGTYLGQGGHPDDKPSEAMFARLHGIEDEMLFNAIALDALRLAATKVSPNLIDKSIRALSRTDAALGGRDARDPFALRDRLEAMLGPDWVGRQQAEGNSCETVICYLHVRDRLEEYFDTVVPAAQRALFRQHQLTMPAGHEKFFRQVKKAVSRYQAACAASRQVRIEAILDNPLEFLLVGRLRLNEHKELRDACRVKIADQIKAGAPLTEPILFQHPYTTRLINDGFRRLDQNAHFALWSWDLLHERLRANHPASVKQPVYNGNKPEDPSSPEAYVIEYLGVTPSVPGGAVQTPLIAEVAASFVLDAPGWMTMEQRERQREACTRWEISPACTVPAGIATFPKWRKHASHDAATLLTSEKPDGSTGSMTLIPIEDFTHGLMFAHSAVFIAADAGCRTGETLLAPSRGSDYEAVPDPATGEVFKRFDSIGKFGQKVQPMVSPDTFSHLTDMIVESAQRWHNGRLPPAVATNSQFQERGIAKVAPFAFSLRNRMINYSELATIARVLYLGWHKLRGHDMRHLFNAMGRRAGISREVRQALLNHAEPHTTDLYGMPTPDEVSRQQMQLTRHVSDRMADLMRSSEQGMTEGMSVALRELQRAEMNERFYLEGGWKSEAAAMRTEIECWAEKLASETARHTGGAEVIGAEAI